MGGLARLEQNCQPTQKTSNPRPLPFSSIAASLGDAPVPVITNIEDLRLLARRRVPRMFYD
jgi:hypothetical protein